MQTQQVKICPQCKTAAPLNASSCSKCGRTYKTQFNQTTTAFASPQTPPPVQYGVAPRQPGSAGLSRKAVWWTIGGAVVVTLFVVSWLFFAFKAPHASIEWHGTRGGVTVGTITNTSRFKIYNLTLNPSASIAVKQGGFEKSPGVRTFPIEWSIEPNLTEIAPGGSVTVYVDGEHGRFDLNTVRASLEPDGELELVIVDERLVPDSKFDAPLREF